MHYNLHKTFSTPHGGGGPGSGPVGVAPSWSISCPARCHASWKMADEEDPPLYGLHHAPKTALGG
jgi:glycine dehydrogenase subunit 2